MARTITEIKDELLAAKLAQSGLDGLTSTSTTAIWRLQIYIIATCIWTLEKLYDIFKIEVDEVIATKKPHSLRWYAEKSKEFQYGYNLVVDADYYDNTGIAADLITASKIVSYAAVVEQIRGVRIKVAKTIGTDLGALTTPELDSFKAYIKRIKDAGVKVNITSTAADGLRAVLRIKYNPLVLDSAGARIDGTTATPVKDAIKDHLKNLPFNGVFSIQKFVDAIQAVEGVNDLAVDQIQSQYGALPFSSINISVIPDSGYLRIEDANLLVTYQAD